MGIGKVKYLPGFELLFSSKKINYLPTVLWSITKKYCSIKNMRPFYFRGPGRLSTLNWPKTAPVLGYGTEFYVLLHKVLSFIIYVLLGNGIAADCIVLEIKQKPKPF